MTIYEDEIDLRPYINTVLKHWWKIGILALALAIIVFAFSILQASSYQATATILVPHNQLKLSLTEQFPTIDIGDERSRMDAYLVIAQSAAIAVQTYNTLEDSLPEDYRVKDLKQNVEISNTGDAIQITATGPTPQLAADIANEWASNTVQAINLAYSGEQPLEDIKAQMNSAARKYQETQKTLETFIESNPITEIQTTLKIAENALNSYVNDQTWQTNFLYQQKQQYAQFAKQAEFIRKQVEQGNSSQAGDVGDALAVMNARGRISGFFPSDSDSLGSTNNVQIQMPNGINIQITDPTALIDSSANYTQDIETILQLSDERIQQINQDIDSLITESYQDIDETFSKVGSDIQALKAQLENLTAIERELTTDRDLAWSTYQTLLQKETEIQTTAETSAVVNFASPAIPPREPESRQILMKTAIAGILGGMIGILWIVIRLWWHSSDISDANHSAISTKEEINTRNE